MAAAWQHLQREKKEITTMVKAATDRRNDIVHKADRNMETETLEKQTIAFAWTQQAVDTIKHVCLGFDELIAIRMTQHRGDLAARQETAHV